MSVNRTFQAIPATVREWVRFLDRLLFARTFSTTLTGCATVPTGTISYVVSAGIATLRIPVITGTSSSGAATFTGVPDEILPAFAMTCVGRVTDNGVTTFGVYRVDTTGTITLFPNATLGAFTAAGIKGSADSVISYVIE